MRSILVVTVPAADTQLLTDAELLAAAGSDDDTPNSTLVAQGRAAAAAIAAACKIRAGSGAQPTLLRETLTETFRSHSPCGWPELSLARRHDVMVSSLTVDDADVDASTYAVDGEAGLITNIQGDGWTRDHGWRGRKIVVVYRAGFLLEQPTDAEDGAELVPEDLKQAASLMVQNFRAAAMPTDRDPLARAITVEGVGSVQYATDSLSTAATRALVPDYVMALLSRYRNLVIA